MRVRQSHTRRWNIKREHKVDFSLKLVLLMVKLFPTHYILKCCTRYGHLLEWLDCISLYKTIHQFILFKYPNIKYKNMLDSGYIKLFKVVDRIAGWAEPRFSLCTTQEEPKCMDIATLSIYNTISTNCQFSRSQVEWWHNQWWTRSVIYNILPLYYNN